MTATLIIGGERFAGWTRVTVLRSIEHLAGSFQVELTERWPGGAAPRPIRAGARCEVELDEEAVIRGHVDAVQVGYGPSAHRIVVAGRDLLADLVDCAAEVRTFRRASASFIASSLAAPFGISVAGGAGKPFETFATEPGETCFEAIARVARLRSLVPISDGLAGLVLGSPSRSPAGVSIETGENVLELRAEVNHSGRFSSYTVLGQQGGLSDWLSAEETAHVAGEARDSAVTRHRPWIQIADQGVDADDARARAEWEKSMRIARSLRVDAVLQGWRERPGGPLWAPGRLVPVTDAYLGLRERELLVAAVRLTLDEKGTRAKLGLTHADALQPEPEPPPPSEDGGWIE